MKKRSLAESQRPQRNGKSRDNVSMRLRCFGFLLLVLVQRGVAQVEPEIDKDSISVHPVRRGNFPVRLMPAGEIVALTPPEVMVSVPGDTVGRLDTKDPARANSEMPLFVIQPGGEARRAIVRFGRESGALIQVLSGLSAGDRVIVTDTSKWNGYERLRLK